MDGVVRSADGVMIRHESYRYRRKLLTGGEEEGEKGKWGRGEGRGGGAREGRGGRRRGGKGEWRRRERWGEGSRSVGEMESGRKGRRERERGRERGGNGRDVGRNDETGTRGEGRRAPSDNLRKGEC